MGVAYGISPTWASQTDEGRTHIATRGIVQDGLVLNLDAGVSISYPGSGTTWTDLSGNGNNGTLVNGVGFDGNNGGSLSFDGVNDYVDINSFTFNSSSVFSASFWFKPLSDINVQYLLDFRESDVSGRGSLVSYNQSGTTGKIHYTVYGDSPTWPSSPTILSLSTWYHITTIHNSLTNNLKIYINSNLDLDSSFGTDFIVSSSPLRIGARRFTQSAPTNGNIAQVSIYNRALTPQEIQQNYNATKSRFQ